MPYNVPTNDDDVIDSRDVISRLEELESERQDLADAVTAFTDEEVASGEDFEEAEKALADWDEENGEELKALKALADEAEEYAEDWQHGATLIRDSYFVQYVQELCDECGDIPKLPSYVVIDWDKTADNMKSDYTDVDFDGVSYWVRN